MGFLRLVGWIFLPYIMVCIRWKNVGKVSKVMGAIWAITVLCITIGIATSSGGNDKVIVSTAQLSDTKATAEKESIAKAVADAKAKEKADADAKADSDAKAKVKATADDAAKNPKWNTSEIYAEKNGNVPLAVNMLKANSDATQNAAQVAPADVMKTPWNYYGKSISFSGVIGFVQDYPPGSNFEKEGILSQIVIGTVDRTGVDILLTVPSGSLKTGDNIAISAVPVGIFDNDNQSGGKTQVLAVVANKLK